MRKLLRLRQHGLREFLRYAVDARLVRPEMRQGVLRRILAEDGLHLPVAGLVDDELRARHVLELEAREEERHAERIRRGNERIPLVGVVRTPERQVELAADAALEGGRYQHVAERHVLGTREFDAADHLIVHREIGAGGHDRSPARRLALGDIVAHAAEKAIRHVLQRRILDAVAILLAEMEDLARIVSEPVVADTGDALDLIGLRVAVDVERPESGLSRLLDQIREIAVPLPELKAVAVALFLGNANLFRRRRTRPRPAAMRMARIARRQLGRIVLAAIGRTSEIQSLRRQRQSDAETQHDKTCNHLLHLRPFSAPSRLCVIARPLRRPDSFSSAKKEPAASYSRTGESRTTLGDGALDFRVRNGNGYDNSSMATGKNRFRFAKSDADFKSQISDFLR